MEIPNKRNKSEQKNEQHIHACDKELEWRMSVQTARICVALLPHVLFASIHFIWNVQQNVHRNGRSVIQYWL